MIIINSSYRIICRHGWRQVAYANRQHINKQAISESTKSMCIRQFAIGEYTLASELYRLVTFSGKYRLLLLLF